MASIERQVMNYVRECWRLLNLHGMGITLKLLVPEEGAPENDYLGRVKMLRDGETTLELFPDAFETREELRATVCHEGCHVLLSRMTVPIDEMLKAHNQSAAAGLVTEMEEQVVERLEKIFSPMLPLPSASLVRNVSRSMDKRKSTSKKGRGSA
jgi:hypothetical protein